MRIRAHDGATVRRGIRKLQASKHHHQHYWIRNDPDGEPGRREYAHARRIAKVRYMHGLALQTYPSYLNPNPNLLLYQLNCPSQVEYLRMLRNEEALHSTRISNIEYSLSSARISTHRLSTSGKLTSAKPRQFNLFSQPLQTIFPLHSKTVPSRL